MTALTEQLLRIVRYNFETHGYLVPVVFIEPTVGVESELPEGPVMVMDASEFMRQGDYGKQALVTAIRNLAEKTRAKSVTMVTENWSLPPDHPGTKSLEAYQVEYEKYHGLSNHPDRTEMVSVIVEARESHQFYMAQIIRKNEDDDHPTLGPWEQTEDSLVGGRFSGFLSALGSLN